MQKCSIQLSVNLDITAKPYIDRIADIIKKYHHEIITPETLASLREDIHSIVREAYDNNIDISSIFPLIISGGVGVHIRAFQSGDIYLEGPNHIWHAFKSYAEDMET